MPRQVLIDGVQSLKLSELALNLVKVNLVPFAQVLEPIALFGFFNGFESALTELFQKALKSISIEYVCSCAVGQAL